MINKDSAQDLYGDIIKLEHPNSSIHKPMSLYNRGAQFSPFAALTGYEEEIKETARLTAARIELDESEKRILDEKLGIVGEQLNRKQKVKITFFQPDERKVGGEYRCISGVVKKIDGYERIVVMEDETRIPVEAIVDIKGEIFQNIEDYFA